MHCETLLQLLDNAGLENGKQGAIDNDIIAHMRSCPHCSSYDPASLLDALRVVDEQVRSGPQGGASNSVNGGSFVVPMPAAPGRKASPNIADFNIVLRRTPKKTKELNSPSNSAPATGRGTSARQQPNASNIAAASVAGTAVGLGAASGTIACPPASGRNVTTQRGPQTGGPAGLIGPGRSEGGRGGSNRPQRS